MGYSRDGVFLWGRACLVCERHGRRRGLVSFSVEFGPATGKPSEFLINDTRIDIDIDNGPLAAHQARAHRLLALGLVPSPIGLTTRINPRGGNALVEEAARSNLVFLRGREQVRACGRLC